MFTVYGITFDGHEDGHEDFKTLQDAVAFLRTVIRTDLNNPDDITFERYGLSFDHTDAIDVADRLKIG